MLKRHMGMSEDIYRPIIDRLNGRITGTMSEVLAATDPLIGAIQLPVFSAWLISRTNDPRRILDAAQEMVTSQPLVRARAALADLDALEPSSKEFVREANRLLRELDSTAARIRAEFAVSTPQGVPLSPIVKVANVGLLLTTQLPIPDLGLKVPMPSWFGRWRDGRHLRSVFRSVVEDLSAIGRLGALRTRLASAVDMLPSSSFKNPPIEDIKWFGRNSRVRKWQ